MKSDRPRGSVPYMVRWDDAEGGPSELIVHLTPEEKSGLRELLLDHPTIRRVSFDEVVITTREQFMEVLAHDLGIEMRKRWF